MAPKQTGFQMTGHWGRMKLTLDPARFKRDLNQNMALATIRAGMAMAGEIRRGIRARHYARNSPFTVLLKRSSAPLVDDADLFASITHKLITSNAVFVGVLRTMQDADGLKLVNLAEMLHNGATIRVTDAMRNMFLLLARVGQGLAKRKQLTGRAAEIAKLLGRKLKQIKPLKPSTTSLRIPGRPFIKAPFTNPKVLKRIRIIWQRAYAKSLGVNKGPKDVNKAIAAVKGWNTRRAAAPKPAKIRDRSAAARKGWVTRRSRGSK